MTTIFASRISRRSLLKAAAFTITAGALSTATAPFAKAEPGTIVGTVIDFAAGVPDAQAVKDGGFLGAVRYVSQRRPGAEWMLGKPVTRQETDAMANLGLKTASVYQFGKEETADWKQGAEGARVHAPQAIELHRAAGGPTGRPIYVAIDDNPTREQYDNQIRPYLQTFRTLLSDAGYSMGIYGNYNTINWAIQDGLGEFFWQHDWGSEGQIHPQVTIHQKAGWQESVGGVTVDVNNVYAKDWGQWAPGDANGAQPTTTATHNNGPAAANLSSSALNLTPQQLQQLREIPAFHNLTVNNLTPQQITEITRVVQSFSAA